MISYFASFHEFLIGFRDGLDPSRNHASPLSTRHCNRATLLSLEGMPVSLSVPVVGSASALKRFPPDRLQVSGHGGWQRVHLGLIQAAYGRAPFFSEIEPAIADLLNEPPISLHDLISRSNGIILDILPWRQALDWVRQGRSVDPRILRRYAVPEEQKSLSMLHFALSRGPEAIFSILEAFNSLR